jgi:hypothetical protein
MDLLERVRAICHYVRQEAVKRYNHFTTSAGSQEEVTSKCAAQPEQMRIAKALAILEKPLQSEHTDHHCSLQDSPTSDGKAEDGPLNRSAICCWAVWGE